MKENFDHEKIFFHDRKLTPNQEKINILQEREIILLGREKLLYEEIEKYERQVYDLKINIMKMISERNYK